MPIVARGGGHVADGRDGAHARRPRDRVQQDAGHPRARPRGAHGARAAGTTQRRARPRGAAARPALHARSVLARGLGDRRQHRHERRRAALPRPRRHGRPRARPRGRVRRRHDRLARGHGRRRPARARDRQRGHARDRHLRAAAPAAAARAPGGRRRGLPEAGAGRRVRRAHGAGGARARRLRVHRRRDAARRSTTWRPACCRWTSRPRC